MPFINCAEATLGTYVPNLDMPWDKNRALHLARRIGLGASMTDLNNALNQAPDSLVDSLIDIAVNLPLAPEPEWAFWQLSDYSPIESERNQQIVDQYTIWNIRWLNDIKNNGLRDRMSWFWHNHFVTRLESYACPSWMYQYHKLLQQHALGNFKDFVYDMGITPAMLIFLNNIQNTQFDTNENYARELYELFTLGVDNGYTQMDITETARAITGWSGIDVNDLCGTVEFVAAFWDAGEKTIFGQTGNWGYQDVIDILFEQRALEISEYICGKIYRHFVNPKEDEQIIVELAEVFRNNNWEIAPVMRTLFKSAHFFDEAHIGTVIPGHIEYFFMFLNEVGYENIDELNYFIGISADEFDQRMFNPTDVSGWPGNRNWITSSTLPYRWEGIQNIMAYFYQVQNMTLEPLRELAIALSSSSETDPSIVSRAVIDHFLPKGLQFDIEYEEALKVFKAEVPENYFENGQWNLNWEYAPAQVYLLLVHLATLPEFQLK